jgi:hypothetical protein
MGDFTGYAVTTVHRFGLYDRNAGTIERSRRWDKQEDAEFFRGRLNQVLQDRFIVVPVGDHELAEFFQGRRVQ